MNRSRSGGWNSLELTISRDPLSSKSGDSGEGLQVIDLGDARQETRQVSQFPRYFDSIWGMGWAPD